MSTPYLGEVKLVSFNFPPKGWAFCNGQILLISQNSALFSLLGTTYGGDGERTFALPDLQGRTPIHFGTGFSLGQSAGEVNHTLTITEMPTHTHALNVVAGEGSKNNPVGNLPATAPLGLGNVYGPPTNVTNMSSGALATTGGGQPHPNVQPCLTVNFVIALQGIFPSRN